MIQIPFLIKQFEDKSLSHYAYAIINEGLMVLIDPARNPQPYYEFAEQQNAKIIGIIETHPHADFVSSHLEMSTTTGAPIYASKFLDADYPHTTFDDGEIIELGNVKLKALNTPGHSPDSICVVLQSEGKDKAVFTGDTLFIGDCGRPDLRENVGSLTAKREDLAKKMYHSLRDKLMILDDEVWVYPAHGAGTLCGKALSEANRGTIKAEKISNWCLQEFSEQDFVNELIADQPFIPQYFSFNVEINKKGAKNFLESIEKVPRLKKIADVDAAGKLDSRIMIIDALPQAQFKAGHLANSFNLQINGKFETWLGSIIAPLEPFYLTAATEIELNKLVERIAKIGYEGQIKAAFVREYGAEKEDFINLQHFKNHQNEYNIIDIRNASEIKDKPIFAGAVSIPLSELRERMDEIAIGKPIMVHCAGGYRSALGSSIIKNSLRNQIVYDLGEAVAQY